MIAESYEKCFPHNDTVVYFSRLLAKKLLIECTSADRESCLASTMGHDLVAGEGVCNKMGKAPPPLKLSPLRAYQTCFSVSLPECRGCETPQTLPKKI